MNNAVFGKYFDLDSALHRLDPRTKFLVLLAVLFNISMYRSGWLVSGILIIWGIRLSGISHKYFRDGLKMFTWFFLFTGGFHLLFTPGRNIFPFSPGGISLTYEGLSGASFYIIRLAMIIVCAALFTSTTSAGRISTGIGKTIAPLARFGIPAQDISVMLMIAITFIPVVFEEAHRLTKAQA
ncbi:MAG: energy-coupling factor transporter transmembrane component T family protein, partial [bacterium]